MGKILMVVNIRHENWKYVFHFTHSYRSFYHKVLHVFFLAMASSTYVDGNTSESFVHKRLWSTVLQMYQKGLWVRGKNRTGFCPHCPLFLCLRELKHRSVKDPSEKFKLQEYVNKEMRSSGCCRSWTLCIPSLDVCVARCVCVCGVGIAILVGTFCL